MKFTKYQLLALLVLLMAWMGCNKEEECLDCIECEGPGIGTCVTENQINYSCDTYRDKTISICEVADDALAWQNKVAEEGIDQPISIAFDKAAIEDIGEGAGVDGYRVYFSIPDPAGSRLSLFMVGVSGGSDVHLDNIKEKSLAYDVEYGDGSCLNYENPLPIQPPFGDPIADSVSAQGWVSNWISWQSDNATWVGDTVYAYTFDRGCIDEMLQGTAEKTIEGIRFYFLYDASKAIRMNLAAIPFDPEGDDFLSRELDFSRPCPNLCGDNKWLQPF